MYKYGKRDGNHQEIKTFFEKLGWSVLDTADLGGGAPDMFVSKHHVTVAVEVKQKRGRLRPLQNEWRDNWSGHIIVARSMDDVIALNNLLSIGKI